MCELRFPESVRMRNGTPIMLVVYQLIPAAASMVVVIPLILAWLACARRVGQE